ncbi:hypothetical protein [Microbacterium rhizomatis]|uniref:Secreted protein n=1 Tax=Microbacterium rhizomatis TaxID=1631477 RepID=A0A5J5J050_9MICO|nr:hypothetical protein [Microbacterium rhizomatis]KAA9106524.1 hypothetical protein F6B43_15440 [Microbacterium rhizomatis]
MPSTSRRVLTIALAVGLSALGLAGCASSTGSTPSVSPDSSTAPADLGSAWLDEGRAVGIVTSGSSTCVPYAGEPTYDAKTATLTVELTDPDGAACTRDFVPRASLVSLPAGVDPTKDLSIVVTGTYAGETSLVGDPQLTGVPGGMTEYLPSAGWYSGTGFLILSWGSSSCVPQLESAEPTSAKLITATFATPPADQVCTADMAPRVTVAEVADATSGVNVDVLLTGGEFDSITVPIAGLS